MDVARSRLVIVKIVTPALTGLALLAGPSEIMYWKIDYLKNWITSLHLNI